MSFKTNDSQQMTFNDAMFGFKIGALNFRKLLKYLGGLDEGAQNPQNA
jgi:hypothetical protein